MIYHLQIFFHNKSKIWDRLKNNLFNNFANILQIVSILLLVIGIILANVCVGTSGIRYKNLLIAIY